MKWLKNIENISSKGIVGFCPYCNSENTDYSTTKIIDDMGYLTMWCNDCKHAFNISRLKITPNLENEKRTPSNLIF